MQAWILILLSVKAAVSVHSAILHGSKEHILVADTDPKSAVSTKVNNTTENPFAPIKVTDMLLHAKIASRYVHTSVITHVQNPDSRAQEVVFSMLLPDTAFISGFTMILDGKSYKAYVKEKEEAKQIYNAAVSQGIAAAHVFTKARDSNHFTISVNVEGNTKAVLHLRYEELLVRRNGLYNLDINIHPTDFVPNLKVVVHINERQKITKLYVPELRTGNEVDATEKDSQNSKAVVVKSANKREATITFAPNIEEQKKLAKIYEEKAKDKNSETYIGNSNDVNKQDRSGLGQFVVQYDVKRSYDGEILANDGYFVYFFAPPPLPVLSKYVVFVLDTSGSMAGRKIEQLRSAMKAILSDLNPNDYFSIVEFNYDVKIRELKEADQEPSSNPRTPIYYPNASSRNITDKLVPPTIASSENIAKALVIVSRLTANGGTNIYDALDVATNLVKKGVDPELLGGYVNYETDCIYNEYYDLQEQRKLEPIMIFLTDGEATTGVTDTAKITSYISEKNSGEDRAPLYSLAFGESADRNFLRKLSLRNEGFMRHIYEAADAALQLVGFYAEVSSPLLSHFKFICPPEQIIEKSISRNQYRVINAGSEVVIVGQVNKDATELTPQVTGLSASEDGLGRIYYEVYPRVSVRRRKDKYLPLERLWAYLTIKQLLDERDASDQKSTDAKSIEKKALDLALKYEFVTPLTSLVVVKPNATNSIDVESADKLPNAAYNGLRSSFAAGPSIARSPVYSKSAPRVAAPAGASISRPVAVSPPADATQGAVPVPNSQPVQAVPDPSPSLPVSPGADYHLENFPWTSPILDSSSDALVFYDDNGNQLTLALTKDSNPPKDSGGDNECFYGLPQVSQAAVGANSTSIVNVCVYVTRCSAAWNISVDDYRNSYCFVNNSYAGVCCPESAVDSNP